MNCQSCHKNLDAYIEGTLSADISAQVELHLKTCDKCKQMYSFQVVADRVMESERKMEPDPFLIARTMVSIEDLENRIYSKETVFDMIFRPVLVTAALAAAVFFGIITGSLSSGHKDNSKIPAELALIDDSVLESINILTTE